MTGLCRKDGDYCTSYGDGAALVDRHTNPIVIRLTRRAQGVAGVDVWV